MAVPPEVILAKINAAFRDAEVELRDTVGDNDHYELTIKSIRFNNISRVLQHKMVMDALGDMVGISLHAISIKTHSLI